MATLIVIDLEATCDDGPLVPRHEMEIIEIGAVALDTATGQTLGELATFVRPRRHPHLTPFCTQLTSIRQSDVDCAPAFDAAMRAFGAWIWQWPAPLAWGSWGDYDRKQFDQDCAHHGVANPLPRDHRNFKLAFSAGRGTNKRFGMAQALRLAGLPLKGTHHRGIDDARNIAALVVACGLAGGEGQAE